LTKVLAAHRTAPGMDAISINLHNPSSDMTLFPLFSEE
jgi:hypothetical protein